MLRSDDGQVSWRNALDVQKSEHAFGAAGLAMHAVAERLCASLADHWLRGSSDETWEPPFEGARLSEQASFTARDEEAAFAFALGQSSSLHTLLSHYEIPNGTKLTGVVERVRQAVKRSPQAKHLVPRFGRALNIGAETEPLKVDFLGQHFACYFVQVTHAVRGIPANAERAYSKLYELQALRRFVTRRRKAVGLLPDERPELFELVLVADQENPVQRRAVKQIQALADRDLVRARPLPDVGSAAQHVLEMERRAA
ncbi:hypothetical protein [Methylibium petroleiphilum]